MDQSPTPNPEKLVTSNSSKAATIVFGILVVLLAVYAVTQKKEPTPATVPAPNTNTNELPGEIGDDDDDDDDVPSAATIPPVLEQRATTSPVSAVTPSGVNVSYIDGVYSSVGNYISPGGAEQIGVTVTLKNGVIENVSVNPMAVRPISQNMQKVFSENFKQYVIGKNIDEVKLDKISSSSLTPKGFNDALEEIKTQAKS